MIMEALDGMKRCSECGAMYMEGEGHSCGMEESDKELDEFSGAGAIAGYSLPLGMRPPGPRRNMRSIAARSFGGLGKKRGKR